MRRAALFAWLIVLMPFARLHGQTVSDSADVAWRAGKTDEAMRLYRIISGRDSVEIMALHRMALMHAWAERYDESKKLFDRLLSIDPRHDEARLDRARVVAWSGDTKASMILIDSMLAADPRNVAAMQLRSQFLSWAGNYSDALRGYDYILELAPESRSTRLDRARVLAWSENFKSATTAYDSLLLRDPNDRDALLGLANVMSLTGQHDSAHVVLTRLLAVNPRDVDALRGIARATTWNGDLVEAERLWREALEIKPGDVDLLVGYAQALRWQGRDAAAMELLDKAAASAPPSADVREQMRWARVAMAPRANANISYEADSDGNRIATAAISGAVRPTRRIEIRADGYSRGTAVSQSVTDTRANGATIGAWMQFEPGWAATLAVGGSRGNPTAAKTIGSMRASITSPGRYPYGGTLTLSRAAVDGTAALVIREVEVQEVSLDAHTRVKRVQLAGGAGIGQFHSGTSGEDNTRWSALAAATMPVARGLTMGLRGRAFGFERDLNDAYFDPDFYGLLEVTGRYVKESNRWSLALEGAPGLQKVRSTGDPSGSYRVSTRGGYSLRPGRTIAVNLAYAKSGLQQLSPTAGADYSYRAIGLTLGWTF